MSPRGPATSTERTANAVAAFVPHARPRRKRHRSSLHSTLVVYLSFLIAPLVNVFDAIVHTGARLGSTQIVMGESNRITPADQARLLRAVAAS